jgi:uncharacterized protein
MTTTTPETRTLEVPGEVRSDDTGRRLVGHAAVYESPSNDLGGGVTETIARGAFDRVLATGPDVVLVLNHDDDHVIARTTSGTLRLRSDERGLAFEADLPDSPLGQNVRESVRRRDLRGASFRFRVRPEGERWAGEQRTITDVAELIDVSIATRPAYTGATVGVRSSDLNQMSGTQIPEATEAPMNDTPAAEATTTTETPAPVADDPEERAEPVKGTLRVTDRNEGAAESRTLHGLYKRAGWEPGVRAAISWSEFEGASEMRALTWTGSVDLVDPLRRAAGPFGFDQRYAWPAFPRVPIDSGVTSVNVMTQTARTLPAAANVVRAIDAVTNKPESASTVTLVTTAVKQVAAVVSGVPNIFLESDQIEQVLANDLRLSVAEGLDKLVIDSFAASGFQAPGTDNILVSVRKAMSTIMASGYSPDTLILTPANAEAIDTMVSGLTGGTADFVFGPGRFAPGTLFGLNVRISKTVAAAVVVDAQAFGRLYASPISLASFEENAGKTNTSLIRLEGNAVFGVERQTAAIRIAAA